MNGTTVKQERPPPELTMLRADLAADVYSPESVGNSRAGDGGWLWDFGPFTCWGSDDRPVSFVGHLEAINVVAQAADGNDVPAGEPERTETVTLYEWDYGVYVETAFDDADALIDPDADDLCSFSTVASARYGAPGDDATYVVLETRAPSGRSESQLATTDELEAAVADGEFVPVGAL